MVSKYPVLQQYLYQIYTLESERAVLSLINNELQRKLLAEHTIADKKPVDQKLINPNEMSSLNIQYIKEPSNKVANMFLAFGVIWLMGGVVALDSSFVAFCVYLIVSLIFLGAGISKKKDIAWVKKQNSKMDEDRQKYINENNSRIERENKLKYTRWKEAQDNIKYLNRYIVFLKNESFEMNKAIQFFYSYNIVHNNYRNLYGISKLYEIIDTKICNRLEGIDGAYSQIRLNEIVDNQKICIELQKKILATNQELLNIVSRIERYLRSDYTHSVNATVLDNQTKVEFYFKNDAEILDFFAKCREDREKALQDIQEYRLLGLDAEK